MKTTTYTCDKCQCELQQSSIHIFKILNGNQILWEGDLCDNCIVLIQNFLNNPHTPGDEVDA